MATTHKIKHSARGKIAQLLICGLEPREQLAIVVRVFGRNFGLKASIVFCRFEAARPTHLSSYTLVDRLTKVLNVAIVEFVFLEHLLERLQVLHKPHAVQLVLKAASKREQRRATGRTVAGRLATLAEGAPHARARTHTPHAAYRALNERQQAESRRAEAAKRSTSREGKRTLTR